MKIKTYKHSIYCSCHNKGVISLSTGFQPSGCVMGAEKVTSGNVEVKASSNGVAVEKALIDSDGDVEFLLAAIKEARSLVPKIKAGEFKFPRQQMYHVSFSNGKSSSKKTAPCKTCGN